MNDTNIAMTGGLLMFVVPVSIRRTQFLLTWKDTEHLQWGILFLFGGGLCLAEGLERTGIIQTVGTWIAATKFVQYMADFSAHRRHGAPFRVHEQRGAGSNLCSGNFRNRGWNAYQSYSFGNAGDLGGQHWIYVSYRHASKCNCFLQRIYSHEGHGQSRNLTGSCIYNNLFSRFPYLG